SEQFDLKVVALGDLNIPPHLIEMINQPMAQLYQVVPIHFKDNVLTVATCDPQNLSIQDEMRTFLGYDIRMVVATERDVQKALGKYYAEESESFETVVQKVTEDAELAAAAEVLSRQGPTDLSLAEEVADSA